MEHIASLMANLERLCDFGLPFVQAGSDHIDKASYEVSAGQNRLGIRRRGNFNRLTRVVERPVEAMGPQRSESHPGERRPLARAIPCLTREI